jgi:hypothetical protein
MSGKSLNNINLDDSRNRSRGAQRRSYMGWKSLGGSEKRGLTKMENKTRFFSKIKPFRSVLSKKTRCPRRTNTGVLVNFGQR